MSSPVSNKVWDNDTPFIGRSSLLVYAAAAASSVPWAVVHGPVGVLWVVVQAMSVGIIPAAAGWLALWRTGRDLKGALRVTVGVAAVLFALQVWSQLR